MERIQKDQGLHLEKLHDKTDFINKIKMLSEDNRVQSERIRELEAKLRFEHEDKRTLKERIIFLESKLDEYRDMVEGKTGEFIPKEEITEMRNKIDKLTQENISFRKINEGQTSKYLKEKGRHLKETTMMREEVSAKDKEIHLLKLKIKELERNLKQGSIRPARYIHQKRRKSTMKKIEVPEDLEQYETQNGKLTSV